MRNLLHVDHLEEFKAWCVLQRIETRPTDADFQVLQVKHRNQWHSIFERMQTHAGKPIVHLTVPTPLEQYVLQFYRERKLNGHG